MKRVALMGVGSLGTIMGALIASKGREITLIDASAAHVEAMNTKGITVTGKLDLQNVPVAAITPDRMEGVYDIVILLPKQTYNAVALGQLLPHLGPESVVCTLQNGVPEESVAAIVGRERVVGGAVGWGATFRGPGVSELTSDLSAMRYEIGELDGSITPRIEEVADLLNLAGVCEVKTNLMGIRWAKVLQNASMSGMSAALGAVWHQILDDEKALSCATWVANEVVQMLNARGDIRMEELVPGYSFYDLEFHTPAEFERAKAFMLDYFAPHRALKASMLQDMEKGIPCEIDYIVGICSAWGRKVGVPTPTCDTIIEIVKDFEAGRIPLPTMACLDRFTLPEIS